MSEALTHLTRACAAAPEDAARARAWAEAAAELGPSALGAPFQDWLEALAAGRASAHALARELLHLAPAGLPPEAILRYAALVAPPSDHPLLNWVVAAIGDRRAQELLPPLFPMTLSSAALRWAEDRAELSPAEIELSPLALRQLRGALTPSSPAQAWVRALALGGAFRMARTDLLGAIAACDTDAPVHLRVKTVFEAERGWLEACRIPLEDRPASWVAAHFAALPEIAEEPASGIAACLSGWDDEDVEQLIATLDDELREDLILGPAELERFLSPTHAALHPWVIELLPDNAPPSSLGLLVRLLLDDALAPREAAIAKLCARPRPEGLGDLVPELKEAFADSQDPAWAALLCWLDGTSERSADDPRLSAPELVSALAEDPHLHFLGPIDRAEALARSAAAWLVEAHPDNRAACSRAGTPRWRAEVEAALARRGGQR